MRPLQFSCVFAVVLLLASAVEADETSGQTPSAHDIRAPARHASDAATATPDSATRADAAKRELAEQPPATLDKPSSRARARAALAESTAAPLSHDDLCATLVQVARENDLPLSFFANLIWRESQFDFDAISPAGAMGIAQFMPDVADTLRLDAFDAREALPASGQLLRTLHKRFGNLGLAAAAYNAGPKRVADWLGKRSGLPRETRDYVQIITGRPASEWQNAKVKSAAFRIPEQNPCHRIEEFALAAQAERIVQEREADAARAESKPSAVTSRNAKRQHKDARQLVAQRAKPLKRIARSSERKRPPIRLASAKLR